MKSVVTLPKMIIKNCIDEGRNVYNKYKVVIKIQIIFIDFVVSRLLLMYIPPIFAQNYNMFIIVIFI